MNSIKKSIKQFLLILLIFTFTFSAVGSSLTFNTYANEIHNTKEIKVAVFDTGIDLNNKGLKVTGGISFVKGIQSFDDDNGHGTEMANIINSSISKKNNVKLYSVKVLDKDGIGIYSDIIKGLDWAIKNQINIISMSFGGTQYSKELEEAIHRAHENNIVIIASSGNDGKKDGIYYPARYKEVICVGSKDKNNNISPFTNIGEQMDVYEQGVNIKSIGLNNREVLLNGTSASTADIARKTAILWSSNIELSNSQIENLLCADSEAKVNLKMDKTDSTVLSNYINSDERNEDFNGNGYVKACYIGSPEPGEVPDGYEPNDNPFFYKTGTFLNSCDVTIMDATISSRNDCDCYQIYVPTTKTNFKITLTNLPTDYNLDLHDSKGNLIKRSNTAGTSNEEIIVSNMAAGYYWVSVWSQGGYSGSYPYKLIIGSGTNNITAYDVQEPNNTIETAAKMNYSSALGSMSSFEDLDYFYFDVPTAGKVSVKLKMSHFPDTVDYDLYVYDSSTNNIKTVGISNRASNSDEEVTFDAPSSGTYHIMVTPRKDSQIRPNIPYEVSYTLTPFDTLHYGEGGTYPATGNFSTSSTDMPLSDKNFGLSISRMYNSKDARPNRLLGRGWTFSLEGSARGFADKTVWLADGSVMNFTKNSDGTYTAKDSRNKLEAIPGGLMLTTKEQYRYGFNNNGWLMWIKDRNDNQISIDVDLTGKINGMTDVSGKHYTILYNSSSLISCVTEDLSNRSIVYSYTNNLLSQVTDMMGNYVYYSYYTSNDSRNNYLQNVKVNNLTTTTLDYYLDGENKYKIKTEKNELGNTFTYTYDNTSGKTIITDINNRQSINWYDQNKFITSLVDNDGKTTTTEYYKDASGKNTFGEAKYYTDRNGNKTEYVRDNQGNVIKEIHYADNSYREFTYDNSNNLTSVKDESGKYTFFVYDSLGKNLIKEVQPVVSDVSSYSALEIDKDKYSVKEYEYYSDDESQQRGYHIKGLLKTATNPEGGITEYTYDEYGNIIKTAVTNSLVEYTYHYNNMGQVDYIISPNGYKTEYTYDSDGLLVKTVLSNGKNETTRTVYDEFGRKVQEIAPNQYNDALDKLDIVNKINLYGDTNVGTRYFYNSSNSKLEKVIDAEGNVTQYTYDIYGNKQTEILPNKSSYKYEYDSIGRITKVLFRTNVDDPNSSYTQVEGYTYSILPDKKILVEQTKFKYINDQSDYKTTYTYDYAGRLVQQTNNDSSKVINTYNSNGTLQRVEKICGSESKITDYLYDSRNQLIQVKTPFEIKDGITYYTVNINKYDKNGNLISVQVTNNRSGEPTTYQKTAYTYNKELNLLEMVTEYQGSTETIGGIPISYTQYYYDAEGRKVRMYTGLSSPLTINGLDNVVETGDSDYSVTKYQYDYRGNIETFIDPLGKSERNTRYDLNGNLIEQYDRNGNMASMTYDNLNRLICKNTNNENDSTLNTSYTCEYKNNNIDNIVYNGIKTSYTYNCYGSVTTETCGDVTKSYEYFVGSNLLKAFKLTKNGTDIINTTYSYDNMNRLQCVFENGLKVAEYKYYDNGNRQEVNYSNGTSEDYEYNLGNKVTKLTNKQGDTILSNFNYEYYMNGNQYSKTDNSNVQTLYNYDDLGRLVKEENTANSGSAISYTYDDYNNRKSMSYGNVVTSYDYDKANHLLSEVNVNGEITTTTNYQYDDNGNQVLKSTESGVQQYKYNTLDQLVSSTVGDTTTTYTYNYDGLRSSKTINGITTYHFWNGDQMVLETDNSGNIKNKYVRGINLIYGEDELANKKFYLFNAHGDVTQLTDTSGNVIKNYDYDAFGNEKNPDVNDTNVFRYSGEYFDKETGTIYLRARYYDPTIGRFITEDSYWGKDNDPLSLNLYTYCSNNPVTFIDPSGNTWTDAVLGFSKGLDDALFGGFATYIGDSIRNFFGKETNQWDYAYENNSDYRTGYNIATALSIGNSIYGGYSLVNGFKMIVTSKGVAIAGSSGAVIKVITGSFEGIFQAATGLGISLISAGNVTFNNKQKDHIFRNEEGHFLKDTQENRQKLLDVANNSNNYLGKDKYGNEWYAKKNSDGTQTWVKVRNGKIDNGGLNKTPRSFNSETGLSSPTKPNQR